MTDSFFLVSFVVITHVLFACVIALVLYYVKRLTLRETLIAASFSLIPGGSLLTVFIVFLMQKLKKKERSERCQS